MLFGKLGLPGCNSVELYKTIWLTRHVQGENQLVPPKPQWLGRASRNKGKLIFLIGVSNGICLYAEEEVDIKVGPTIRNASLLQKRHKTEPCPYTSEDVW